MKKYILFLMVIMTVGFTVSAAENNSRYFTGYDGSKYAFSENGIEFSVFPDGEFDFYIPQYVGGIDIELTQAQ